MIIPLNDTDSQITNPADVHRIISALLAAEDEAQRDREHFWVFHLDGRSKIKLLELVSIGTLTASLVHPREVFTRAVKNRSAALVIAHNHPSGVAEPSRADVEITEELVHAGKILGIKIMDHVIVADEEHYSFRENQLI